MADLLSSIGSSLGDLFGEDDGDAFAELMEEQLGVARRAEPCSLDLDPPRPLDLDALEAGRARAYLGDEFIQPCQAPASNRWICCHLVRQDKDCFHMYLESGNRFLLSALRTPEGDFYISQYEEFPERYVEEVRARRRLRHSFCATLGRTGPAAFRLELDGCEYCDRVLEKFQCGPGLPHAQTLAEIAQGVKIVPEAGSEVRSIRVQLPLPGAADGAAPGRAGPPRTMRECAERLPRGYWCSRTAEEGQRVPDHEGGAVGAALPKEVRKMLRRSGAGAPSRAPGAADGCSHALRLQNKVPEWSEALQSLVLKFAGSRVHEASAKNFLMFLEDEVGREAEEAVLQFGKQGKAHFSLDFRYPLSVIQAFAVCLSVHSWQASVT